MTPEQLARETGWDLTSWQRARDTTGPLWPQMWRPIAELAALLRETPDSIATQLIPPDTGSKSSGGHRRRSAITSRFITPPRSG